MSVNHCGDFPLASKFYPSLLLLRASARLTWFPVTQMPPLSFVHRHLMDMFALPRVLLSCSHWFDASSLRSQPRKHFQKSLLLPQIVVGVPIMGLCRCTKLPLSQCSREHGLLLHFSDFTHQVSRGSIVLNSVASSEASTLSARKLEGSLCF